MSDIETFAVADSNGNPDQVRVVYSTIDTSGLDGRSSERGLGTNYLVSTGETLNAGPDGTFITLDQQRTFRLI